MGDSFVRGHLAGMIERRTGKNGVAVKRWKTTGRPVLIGGG
jgi:hypothetical protein